LARDIAGNEKTVTSISRNDFERYRKLYYGSNNVVVTIAGGIKGDEAVKIIEKYFGEVKDVKKKKFKSFESKTSGPRVLLSSKKKEQAHFILGFLAGKRGDKNRFEEAVLSIILGQGMSSRMFTEVREKRGLAYAVSTTRDRNSDVGYLGTQAGVDTKRVDEAIKVVMEQSLGIANGKFPINEKELTKAKEYIKGQIALSLEDTRDVSGFFGTRELLLGKIETVESYFAGIDKVSLDSLNRVAKKVFQPEKMYLAIIGPYDDAKRFEKFGKVSVRK
jgi:predicted Zn-dependent peptidase